MPILYGVSFPELISSLPRRCAKGIPGNEGWAAWAGWSIEVKTSRLLIYQEPQDLTDENVQGVSPGARDEHAANLKDEKSLRQVYSVPTSLCVLHYLDGMPANKASQERSPTPALLALLEERKNAPPVRPPGVPTTQYQGPAVTPMARARPVAPPGASVRPVVPPPSEIVMDDEPEASAP